MERILAYGLSRDLDFHDEELVNELVDHFESSGYSVPQLIGEIVSNEKFSTEELEERIMASKSWHFGRRTFLRGAGVPLGLPFLNAMAGASESKALAALPKRAAFIFFPNGVSLPT